MSIVLQLYPKNASILAVISHISMIIIIDTGKKTASVDTLNSTAVDWIEADKLYELAVQEAFKPTKTIPINA